MNPLIIRSIKYQKTVKHFLHSKVTPSNVNCEYQNSCRLIYLLLTVSKQSSQVEILSYFFCKLCIKLQCHSILHLSSALHSTSASFNSLIVLFFPAQRSSESQLITTCPTQKGTPTKVATTWWSIYLLNSKTFSLRSGWRPKTEQKAKWTFWTSIRGPPWCLWLLIKPCVHTSNFWIMYR